VIFHHNLCTPNCGTRQYVTLAIHVCYKCIFQMFQLFLMYVASVLTRCCICCSVQTHILQAYVVNVSSVSDVYCTKCFMSQVFHMSKCDKGAEAKVVPSGVAIPVCAREAKQAWSTKLCP
jgi:hypothetical protein